MTKYSVIKLFQNSKNLTIWIEEEENWQFSVDVLSTDLQPFIKFGSHSGICTNFNKIIREI